MILHHSSLFSIADLFYAVKCRILDYLFIVPQVNACSSIDLILGVLGWSTGCSWPCSVDANRFLEC